MDRRPGRRSRAEPSSGIRPPRPGDPRGPGASRLPARDQPTRPAMTRTARPPASIRGGSSAGSTAIRASSSSLLLALPLLALVVIYLGSLALLLVNAFWTLDPFTRPDRPGRSASTTSRTSSRAPSTGPSPCGPSAWPRW